MGKLLKTDGTTIEVRPANGTDYTLDELQKLVGGYIEVIPAREKGYILVINEEGKLENLPYNGRATELADIYLWDYIVGDALLCKDSEVR